MIKFSLNGRPKIICNKVWFDFDIGTKQVINIMPKSNSEMVAFS